VSKLRGQSGCVGSYASQARDDTLFNFATRIKARALAIRKPRFWFTVTSLQKANNRKEWT
jgi:hypothetical protein